METTSSALSRTVDRRRFLRGAGAAAVVGSAATVGVAAPVSADDDHYQSREVFPRNSAPKPIAASIDTTPPGGEPAPAPFNEIHWLLPGPEGAVTQILGLQSFGLDADPSTITDFDGFLAYAVIAGKAEDGNGQPYDVEFDVRVMDGRYIGEDGKRHHGTFAFL